MPGRAASTSVIDPTMRTPSAATKPRETGVLAGLRHLITLGHLGHHNGPPVSTVATTTQVTSGGT